MKAIVYHQYGTPKNMKLEEMPLPEPGENEVLIKVHAVSVNSWDWDMLRGKPVFIRMWGLFIPGHRVLGADIAGTVHATGPNASWFEIGDKVFGDISGTWGGFAEYVCAPKERLALIPSGMSYSEAAAIPQAATLALQGLKYIKDRPGLKVLINGAGGGVGTFAIQLAKFFKAEVTAVDSASKIQIMQNLGADYCLDYNVTDFAKTGIKYDLILDLVCTRSIFSCSKALKKGGRYVIVGGSTSCIIQTMLLGPLISKFTKKSMGLLMWKPETKDLIFLAELYSSGKLKPILDKKYPLEKTPEALQYLGDGHPKGKLVVQVC